MRVFSKATEKGQSTRMVMEHPGGDAFVVGKYFGDKLVTIKFWRKSFEDVDSTKVKWISTPDEQRISAAQEPNYRREMAAAMSFLGATNTEVWK